MPSVQTLPLLHSAFGFRHSRQGWPLSCFYLRSMEKAGSTSVATSSPAPVQAPAADITFNCVHCSSALVVDAAAQGMTLTCQRCGKPTPVPVSAPKGAPDANAEAQLADVRRQLKENESQRTEITSYINQLSIQLHRWQLRLQMLNERKQELDKQLRES